jgi:hypothetical protein
MDFAEGLTEVVEVVVDPRRNLGREEEYPVRRQHDDPALRLVALQLHQHRDLEQDLKSGKEKALKQKKIAIQ